MSPTDKADPETALPAIFLFRTDFFRGRLVSLVRRFLVDLGFEPNRSSAEDAVNAICLKFGIDNGHAIVPALGSNEVLTEQRIASIEALVLPQLSDVEFPADFSSFISSHRFTNIEPENIRVWGYGFGSTLLRIFRFAEISWPKLRSEKVVLAYAKSWSRVAATDGSKLSISHFNHHASSHHELLWKIADDVYCRVTDEIGADNSRKWDSYSILNDVLAPDVFTVFRECAGDYQHFDSEKFRQRILMEKVSLDETDLPKQFESQQFTSATVVRFAKPYNGTEKTTVEEGKNRNDWHFGVCVSEYDGRIVLARHLPYIGEQKCVIENEEQMALMSKVIQRGGKLSKREVGELLPDRHARVNAVRRLRESLGTIQLTFRCEKSHSGQDYVVSEVSE